MTASTRSATTARRMRMAGGTGLAAGITGILASSCCVLPIVFVGLGLGSVAAAVIPALALLRPYLIATALLAVAVGWVSLLRGRGAATGGTCDREACEPCMPTRHVPMWLWLATAVVVLALLWQPMVEPRLLTWIR